MKRAKKSQQVTLLQHLKRHRSIDPLTALNALGIYRLADTVYKLRRQGIEIETHIQPVKTRHGTARVARYVLQ